MKDPGHNEPLLGTSYRSAIETAPRIYPSAPISPSLDRNMRCIIQLWMPRQVYGARSEHEGRPTNDMTAPNHDIDPSDIRTPDRIQTTPEDCAALGVGGVK
jgi:hypothetical protein